MLRKAHFENAQSKDKQMFKSKELVLQYFCSVSKVHIGKGTWWLPTLSKFAVLKRKVAFICLPLPLAFVHGLSGCDYHLCCSCSLIAPCSFNRLNT